MARYLVPLVFVAACLVAGSAQGQAARPAEPAPPADPGAAAPLSPAPLSSGELGDISGGSETKVIVTTDQSLVGASTNNSVVAGTLTTGAVNFGQGALDGFAGIGNFVINTGANNTLQGAINVSIVTAPTP